MDSKEIQSRLEGNIEMLADIEHQRWAHWQAYLHSKCERQSDGSLVIPADLVQRWERQIETPYAELTAIEKKSDQEQVKKVFPLISKILSN